MTNKKKIKELENRINRLEAEFNKLLSQLTGDTMGASNALSYEEVIDLWLNGKEAH